MLHAVVAGAVAGEAPAAPHHARHPSLGRELREKLGIEIHSTGRLQISSQNFYSFFRDSNIFFKLRKKSFLTFAWAAVESENWSDMDMDDMEEGGNMAPA